MYSAFGSPNNFRTHCTYMQHCSSEIRLCQRVMNVTITKKNLFKPKKSRSSFENCRFSVLFLGRKYREYGKFSQYLVKISTIFSAIIRSIWLNVVVYTKYNQNKGEILQSVIIEYLYIIKSRLLFVCPVRMK